MTPNCSRIGFSAKPLDRKRASAKEHLMRTFFDDSPSGAILGLLDMSAGALTEKDIAEIRAHIKDVEKPEGD